MTFEASRLHRIKTSPSMAISQAAKQMIRDGIDVIDLSLGEPDFNTPENVAQAGIAAIQAGQTRYTAPAGTIDLQDAIAAKLQRDAGATYKRDEITVGNGAKQIIFNALLATLEPGDEVILLAPYFVSYPDQVRLHGGEVVVVPTAPSDGFRPRRDALAAAVNERTRWIVINTPSNPSGAVFSREDLAMIGDVIAPHERVLVLSDEIYEKITFAGSGFTSFVAACPALRDRTLLVNGLSKSHAMTGWRIGYGAGPASLIRPMTKLASQSTTSPCAISQAAAIEALNGDQTFVETARAVYEARRDRMIAGLADIPLLDAFSPEGAFYVFADCSAMIGRQTPNGEVIENDTDAASYLLQAGRVACVPGAAYGLEPFVRFSFATSEAAIDQALANLSAAIAEL